jgi:hypothetical protein
VRKPTWKEKQAAWKARQRAYQRKIHALQLQLVRRNDRIEALVLHTKELQVEREQRHREQAENWQLYDAAYASISRQEQQLFENSPAYKQYQRWRDVKAGR